MKRKSEGTQAFNVPATDEGKAFVKLLRKFANKPDCQISVRGRGKRSLNGKNYAPFNQSLPLGLSEWFAVYVRSIKNNKGHWDRYWKTQKELNANSKRIVELEEQVKGLKIALVESQERANELARGNYEVYKQLKSEKLKHDVTYDPNPNNNPFPANPPLGTVTISVKGAHIRIVQEQE